MNEQWKTVSEFPNYEVSNKGRVRNKHNARLMSPSQDRFGYKQIGLTKNGRVYCRKVHRLVATAFIGPPTPDRPEVNHINSNKADNRVENLEWCDRQYNMQHAYDAGGIEMPVGEDNRAAKLSNKDVFEIRKLYSMGMGPTKIARTKKFPVGISTINKIVNGVTWTHLLESN